jgi:hypothetical protein
VKLLRIVIAGVCILLPREVAVSAAETSAAPVLVELFTSEGCSSCPPADRFLKELDKSQPFVGAQLVVLSEHVDYWDHDGWKDPFSSHLFTDRQQAYTRSLHLKEPYTPEIIIDGSVEVQSRDPGWLNQVIQKAAASPKASVRLTSVTVDTSTPAVLRGRIEAESIAAVAAGEVYLAVALDQTESDVTSGENGGHRLENVAVVQELVKVGKLARGNSIAQDFQRKLRPGTDLQNLRLVAFVQETGPGRVLGAVVKKPPLQ